MLRRLLPSPDGLLLRTLRGTEWSQLADYVSPSFFDVLPARSIWSQLRELGGNAADGDGFAGARERATDRLAPLGHALRIGPGDEAGAEATPEQEASRRRRGQQVLEIYFAQLAAGPEALLDLRASRFSHGEDGSLVWSPRPLWLTWDPGFLAHLRELYAGFYRGEDERFRAALAGLELEAAEDVFREHFGGGDQRAVRFDAKAFHATFHEAFVRCRDAGVKLHGNFLALGIYLGCLYDHLEALGLAFDVREAWERAQAATQDAPARGHA